MGEFGKWKNWYEFEIYANPVWVCANWRKSRGMTWDEHRGYRRRMRNVPLFLYRRKRNLLKGERRWISIDGVQIPVAE